jgi:serine/threonine-protein kinase
MAWVVAATIAWAGVAHGQGGVQERAVARGLFDQARALMKDGKHAQACPKLEESQRLDPGVGTQFNLGNCYEHVGRAASAWLLYLEVAAASRAAGQTDRENAARERAAAVEPRVSRLVVQVTAEQRAPGMKVNVDGMTVGEAMWGTPMPMDAGSHKIEVSAPGRRSWATAAAVPAEGKVVTVSVPALETASAEAQPAPQPIGTSTPEVAAPQVPAPEAKQPPRGSTQRLAGAVVAGLGVVGLGVSGALVLSAKSSYGDSSPHCTGNYCDDTGIELRDEARGKGTAATVVGAIGLAAVAAGAVVYFTAPGAKPGSARVGLGPGWMGIGGQW